MKRILCTVFLFLAFLPFIVSALTIEDIKAQIQSILARIEILKSQSGSAGTITASSTSPTLPTGLPCLSLARTLSIGSRGDDVRELQRFLIKAGLLSSGSVTGYFGLLTEAAVKKFQVIQGIVSSGDAQTTGFGRVGPKTRASILARCARNDAKTGPSSCPKSDSLPIASECDGTWEKVYDASHCLTGYQCEEKGVNIRLASTSIRILSPSAGTVVTGGNTMRISWKSTNAPARATVSLSLIDSEGASLGTIAEGVNPSGTYLWQVPAGSDDCTSGESPIDCITKFSRCEGSESICSVPPGTYTILATLNGSVRTASPLFQIAGTAISDLLQAIVGAPIVPPAVPGNLGTGTPPGAGMCMHEGFPYSQGTTLSVPCQGISCTSSGTGYITGACTGGQWCIPFTSYCASVLTQIDVSAYEGGGAAPIGTGNDLNCGAENWRAYLECTAFKCTSGYYICRGGHWARDPDQTPDF